jgi:hypothetical protein
MSSQGFEVCKVSMLKPNEALDASTIGSQFMIAWSGCKQIFVSVPNLLACAQVSIV